MSYFSVSWLGEFKIKLLSNYNILISSDIWQVATINIKLSTNALCAPNIQKCYMQIKRVLDNFLVYIYSNMTTIGADHSFKIYSQDFHKIIVFTFGNYGFIWRRFSNPVPSRIFHMSSIRCEKTEEYRSMHDTEKPNSKKSSFLRQVKHRFI